MQLAWQSLRREHVHVARVVIGAGGGHAAHDHDFAEVFWLEDGRLRHEINDRQEELGHGAVVWMRPRDRHRLRVARGAGSATLVNLALPWPEAEALAGRYPDLAWAWTHDEPEPRRSEIGDADQTALRPLVAEAAAPTADALLRDLLVLRLARAARPADRSPPLWLAMGLRAFDADPEGLIGGVARLVAHCGRSLDHLNRAVRASFGCTSTELVRRRRLDAAARRLALGDEDILAISLACGFENLGYFYRSFRTRFDCTPRRYRLEARATAG